MAFGDFDSTDPIFKAKSAVSFGVLPTNGWHLEILQLPFTTSVEEIQTLFTKYGTIDRVAIIHKIKDQSVVCYISYEKESDSSDALRENGKRVGTSSITVAKYENSNVDKGNKRLRTDDTSTTAQSDGWGSGTTTSDNSGGWGSAAPTGDSWGGGGASSSPARASRGRGGGRGGASGGGGRACFKCGEEGHMSRECPKGGGGGGGSRACFKCGEEGHMSRECPKNTGGGGSRACFKCGEEGHISRDCPKGGGRACFNCNEEGHMSRDCSKPRSGRGRGRGGGGNFGDRGNSSNSCASEWGSSEPSSAPVAFDSSWD